MDTSLSDMTQNVTDADIFEVIECKDNLFSHS